MSTKKSPKPTPEELQNALQALIAQGKKEGMIRAADLNALLEKMTLTPEKIEEIYDRFEAMNIQIVTAELDLGDDVDLAGDADIDLAALEEEDLIVIRDMEELFKVLLGVLEDLVEHLRSVTHLHDGHTGSLIVGDL